MRTHPPLNPPSTQPDERLHSNKYSQPHLEPTTSIQQQASAIEPGTAATAHAFQGRTIGHCGPDPSDSNCTFTCSPKTMGAHGHVPMALGLSPASQTGLASPLHMLCFIPRLSCSVCPPMSSGPVGLPDEFWRYFLSHPWYHGLLATGKCHRALVTGILQTSPDPVPWPSTEQGVRVRLAVTILKATRFEKWSALATSWSPQQIFLVCSFTDSLNKLPRAGTLHSIEDRA